MNRILYITLVFLLCIPALANSDAYQGSALIDRYRSALENQETALRNIAMEVHMEGRLPKLKKEGKMSAMRMISSVGKVSYKLLGFWGDDTVKKEVMARYMNAEVESASHAPTKESQSIAITPQNYEFKYKGLNDREQKRVHVFELKPRHKRLGLFKGELWLDPETCLPLRESGRLVKSPSVWVKKMEFARYYEIKDGVAYLKRMETKTDTRIVGRAELNIEYANVQKQTDSPDEEPVAGLPVKEPVAGLR